MKRFFAIGLSALMLLGMFAGCGKSAEPTQATETTEAAKQPLTDSLDVIIEKIYAESPTEIAVMTQILELSDTSEDGLWLLKSSTGLDSAELISEAAVSEAMIGSIPYSMVLVRVKDAANAKAVAEKMKEGIDPRKWICVEADDMQVSGYCDVVMLVMIGSGNGSAQSFTDGFAKVAGGQLDFTI